MNLKSLRNVKTIGMKDTVLMAIEMKTCGTRPPNQWARRILLAVALLFHLVGIAQAQNVLTNPGFEGTYARNGADMMAPSWKRFPIDGITRSQMAAAASGTARSGSKAQAVSITHLMNGAPRLATAIPGGIVSNSIYEACVWVKSAKSNSRVSLVVQNGNAWFPTDYASAERVVGQQWTQILFRFQALATDSSAELAVRFNEENTWTVDDASFRPLSPGSDRPSAPPAGNLLRYGSFETGDAGWFASGVKFFTLSDVTAPHGSRCAHVDWNGGTGNRLQSLGMALPWGYPYTISWYAKGEVGAVIGVGISSGGQSLASTNFTLASTGWRRFSVTWTLPPTPDGIYYLVIAPPGTGSICLDAVQIETGSAATGFAPYAPVEAELNLAQSGGVYKLGADVTGTVSLFNASGSSKSISLSRRVCDSAGSVLPGASSNWVQTVRPGRTDLPILLLPSAPRTGAFRAECFTDTDTTPPYGEALFSVLPVFSSTTNAPFGITLDYNKNGRPLFRKAGFGWAKTWSLNWDAAQPAASSKLSFTSGQDGLVNDIAANGYATLGILSEAPSWEQVKPLPGWGWANPVDFSLQSGYASAAVSRYQSRVAVWELENEPNQSEQPSVGNTRGTAYAKEAAALMKGVLAADSGAKILLGSVTIRDEIQTWLQEVLSAQPVLAGTNAATGRLNLYGVSFHFYTGDPGIIRRVASDIRGMLQANGLAALKVWDTEWAPYNNCQSLKRAEWRGVTLYGPSPQRGAAEVVQGMVARLGEGIESSVLYDTYNAGDMNNADFKLMLELDGSLRPAAAAMAVLAGHLAGCTSPQVLSFTGGYAYRFQQADSHPVTVLWADDYQSGPVSYVTRETVTAFDMMGNKIGSYPPGTVIAIPGEPVYLVGLAGTFTAWQMDHFGPAYATLPTAQPLAAPAGDGVPNLLKYAVNLDPETPVSGARGVVSMNYTNGAFSLSFLRAHSDVTYTVEGSPNLAAWTPIATNPDAVGQFVTVYDPAPGEFRRFLRLRISQP